MSTTQDYQAAEQLLRRPARPGELVIGDKVRPQWIDGGARFWYAVSNGVGRRFVLVDPAAGTREPAFDHARLAAALAAASGQQVDPEALPFMAIELAGNAVEFDAFGEHWRCRLDSYACERAEFTPPGNPLEVPSPDKKVAVSRRGHDLWARSLSDGREWALTTDGEPDYQYGSGPDCTSNGTLLRKFGLPHLPPAVAWSPDSTKVLAHRTDERGVRQTHLVEARPADGGAPLLRTQRYAYPGDEQVPHAELVVLDVADGHGGPRAGRAAAHAAVVADHDQMGVVGSGRLGGVLPQPAPRPAHAHPAPAGTGHRRGHHRAQRDRDHPRGAQPVDVPSRRSCGCWPTRCCGTRSGTAGATCTGTTCAPARCSGRSPPGNGRCGRSCTSTRPSGWCTSPPPGWSKRIRTGARCAGSVLTAPASPRSPTTSWTTSSPCRTTMEYFIDSASTVDTPPVSRVRDWSGRVLVELERADITKLTATGWTPPERFRVKAADGVTDIYGVLYRPRGFDPAQRYPVVDSVYPGPQVNRVAPCFDPGGMGLDAEPIAALGFVVFAVDGRGTPGRSKSFHDASYGHLADAGCLADHVAALRQLAQTRPWMDLDRVGAFGHSGGGFATARAMLDFPEVYKAGVALSGSHDARYFDLSFVEAYDGADNPEAWARASNVDIADRLAGKLLLIHGEMDDQVHPDHTLRLADRLIAADKDFELLIVPGAEHTFIDCLAYVRKRCWDFLVRELMGTQPPAYRPAPIAIDPELLGELFA